MSFDKIMVWMSGQLCAVRLSGIGIFVDAVAAGIVHLVGSKREGEKLAESSWSEPQ